MTVKEAAEALGVSERTVYEMVYKNQIPYRRIEARGRRGQGKILIARAALKKWLMGESCEQSANGRGNQGAFVRPNPKAKMRKR